MPLFAYGYEGKNNLFIYSILLDQTHVIDYNLFLTLVLEKEERHLPFFKTNSW